MKLSIENWLDEKEYKTDIKKLFLESIICYKNNAYRASLLFSYLGFLTIIKETIIKSPKPSSIPEGRWESLIKDIKKDDKWESTLFDATQNASSSIFNMNDDLRLQIKYWKDRRNDCAHFKRNDIESHHIEAFWSFLKSNISKITIEGGLESLLNKFDIHFDETFTPPNQNFDHLIKGIPESIEITQRESFLLGIKKRLDGGRFGHVDSDAFKVYNRILEIGDSYTKEELIIYLKKEKKDVAFLNDFPKKIELMAYTSSQIRSLWKNRIFNGNFINPYTIYASLLRLKLIPLDNIQEANSELFNQTDSGKIPLENDIETLKANSFFEYIIKIAIYDKELTDYLWVNSNFKIITLSIEQTTLNEEIVKVLCDLVTRKYYSWILLSSVNQLLKVNKEFRKQFLKIATAHSINLNRQFSFKDE